MRLAALYSGGKDSTYALYLAQRQGHEVTHLISLHPREESMMFHVPNIRWTALQAEALGIPLLTREAGEGEEAEMEALRMALSAARATGAEGVVAGAVASRYQAKRIRRVAADLGLEIITPLWGMDPAEEVSAILRVGFEAIFVAVAAEGFSERWLGRYLDAAALQDLQTLHGRYGIHISGEGGEYETMVLDGPNFSRVVKVQEAEKSWGGQSGVYRIIRAELIPKRPGPDRGL